MTTLALRNATLDDDLEAALTSARERYTLENPKSAAQQETSKAYMPGGNTRSVLHYAPFPLAFVKGEGNYLWSADGARYTDFLGEYTAGLRIPTQGGHAFRFDRGHRSDLMAATIPI